MEKYTYFPRKSIMNYKFNLMKELYPSYIIYIKQKNKYYTNDIDKNIIEYFDDNLKNINYIVLDNLDIVEKVNFYNNTYDTLYIKTIIINIIKTYYAKKN